MLESQASAGQTQQRRAEEAVKQRESAVRVLGENETALLAKETEVQALATRSKLTAPGRFHQE